MEEESLKNDMYYLPISVTLNDEKKFNELIIDYVRENQKRS